jgi:hypothetical protein
MLMWSGADRRGLGIGNDASVAYGAVGNGELEQPEEDEPPTGGAATVEAEHELVEVGLQVRVTNRALLGARQPALRQ